MLGQLCRNLDEWIARVPKQNVLAWDGPDPKFGRNESIADALERCRRRIRQLDADRHIINSAPIPSGEAKAVAKGYVAHLVEIGAPDVYGLVETGGRIEWPQRQMQYIPDSSVSDINPDGSHSGRREAKRDSRLARYDRRTNFARSRQAGS